MTMIDRSVRFFAGSLLLLLLVAVSDAGAQETTPLIPKEQPAASETTGPVVPSPAPSPPSNAAPEQAEGDPEKTKPNIAPKAPEAVQDIKKPLDLLGQTLDRLTASVEEAQNDDEVLSGKRPEIEKVEAKAREIVAELKPRLDTIKKQIDKLGPPPTKDEPPEAQQIADERVRLNSVAAEISGAIKTSELLQVRARQLASRVQDLRQSIFARQILRRSRSPLSAELWREVGAALPSGGLQFIAVLRDWRSAVSQSWPQVTALALVTLAVYWLLRILMSHAVTLGLQREPDRFPTFFERAAAAGWVAPALVVPGALASVLAVYGLDALGLLYFEIKRIVMTALPAFLIFLVVRALARSILQPKWPMWRLFDLSDRAAKRLAVIVSSIAAVYALDLVFQEIIRALFLPLNVRIAEASIASLAFAGLLFAMVRTRFTAREALPVSPPELPGPAKVVGPLDPKILKLPVVGVAFAILIASFFGYVALGRFIAGQVVVTGSIAVVLLLFHLAIRALTTQTDDPAQPASQALAAQFGLDPTHSRFLARGASFVLHALLGLIAIPLLFISWGYSIADTLAWLKAFFFGFEIGDIRISLAKILFALMVFAAVLIVTRLIQRWITRRMIHPARMDQGIANSAYTAVGYLGAAIATLLAVAYAGFDITNLAIVAGALSVGIGFGLQSIVNNFVSGLILLVERPIKVGDWVVVKEHQGHVRRISVRSTEIETFDRASVIVPNSDFITSTVLNWTHRNALGRVVVDVGVSYQSDPEHVQAVLAQVAAACPSVLRQPGPLVFFMDFGASSLDFRVCAYVADINNRMSVATELRTRIYRAFKKESIEIPFPQHDIHLRDLDPVRTVLTRIAHERAAAASEDPPNGDISDPPQKQDHRD